jgi:hypothetical protein
MSRTFNEEYEVWFESLTGGPYSSNPGGPEEPPIRTNNPAWLTDAPWHASRPGYVGVRPQEQTDPKTGTVIYRTPEHGIAAWYYLLADHLEFEKQGGFVSVKVLAYEYDRGNWAGSATTGDYLNGWKKRLPEPGKDSYSLSDDKEMLILAKAMFGHERDGDDQWTKAQEAQILFAIQRQRAGTMPP